MTSLEIHLLVTDKLNLLEKTIKFAQMEGFLNTHDHVYFMDKVANMRKYNSKLDRNNMDSMMLDANSVYRAINRTIKAYSK